MSDLQSFQHQTQSEMERCLSYSHTVATTSSWIVLLGCFTREQEKDETRSSHLTGAAPAAWTVFGYDAAAEAQTSLTSFTTHTRIMSNLQNKPSDDVSAKTADRHENHVCSSSHQQQQMDDGRCDSEASSMCRDRRSYLWPVDNIQRSYVRWLNLHRE